MAFLPLIGGLGASGIAGLGAGLLGAVGSVSAGYATQQAQDYNAKVAMIQAKTANEQAASDSAAVVDKTRVQVGRAIAGGIQSGSDFSGSWRDYVSSSDALGHLDALTKVYKGEVLSTGYRNQASADIFAGNQAFNAGLIGAGTNLMRGVATVYKGGNLDFGFG